MGAVRVPLLLCKQNKIKKSTALALFHGLLEYHLLITKQTDMYTHHDIIYILFISLGVRLQLPHLATDLFLIAL